MALCSRALLNLRSVKNRLIIDLTLQDESCVRSTTHSRVVSSISLAPCNCSFSYSSTSELYSPLTVSAKVLSYESSVIPMEASTPQSAILGRVFNSLDSHLNGLKMAKSCQTSLNSWLISRYYLRYFPCLTTIYLIFITIFEMKTCPRSIANG